MPSFDSRSRLRPLTLFLLCWLSSSLGSQRFHLLLLDLYPVLLVDSSRLSRLPFPSPRSFPFHLSETWPPVLRLLYLCHQPFRDHVVGSFGDGTMRGWSIQTTAPRGGCRVANIGGSLSSFLLFSSSLLTLFTFQSQQPLYGLLFPASPGNRTRPSYPLPR